MLYETKYGNFLLSRVSSIIDVKELDFRVRYGNGYFLFTMVTAIKTIYERKKNVKRVRKKSTMYKTVFCEYTCAESAVAASPWTDGTTLQIEADAWWKTR